MSTWIQTIYGSVGIVKSRDCDCHGSRVHAVHAYDGANYKAGDEMHPLRQFVRIVPEGTPEPEVCKDPHYWASLV